MGRASLVIDYKKLQEEIDYLESKEMFVNYTELCNSVYRYDESLQPDGCCKTSKHRRLSLHPQQCYQALAKKQVTAKTQPGKRGRQAGVAIKRTTKADKFAGNQSIQTVLDRLEKEVPEAYMKLFERARNGSMKAFIQLKCAACTGYTKMYKSCDCPHCPLLPLNLMMWPKRANSEDFEYDPMDKVIK